MALQTFQKNLGKTAFLLVLTMMTTALFISRSLKLNNYFQVFALFDPFFHAMEFYRLSVLKAYGLVSATDCRDL